VRYIKEARYIKAGMREETWLGSGSQPAHLDMMRYLIKKQQGTEKKNSMVDNATTVQ
jgi:hypothetical protein